MELADLARAEGQQFDCAIWLHKIGSMPKEHFKREVEWTGRETEPWGIIYFKLYKSQIPVIDQAIEAAALMSGSDKSRGYCLERPGLMVFVNVISQRARNRVLAEDSTPSSDSPQPFGRSDPDLFRNRPSDATAGKPVRNSIRKQY